MEYLFIHPPIRLVVGATNCHRCGHLLEAVGVVAEVEEDGYGDTAFLSYIQSLPESLLELIQSRFPCFELADSATADAEYYANTCPVCGALAGDHFLQAPGGLFCPMDDEPESALHVEILEIEGPLQVSASCTYGLTSWIQDPG